MTEVQKPLLAIKGLKKYFPIQQGFLRRTVGYVKAVDDVNLSIAPGETLGVVGESGCGKTTLGRCILRLYEPTEGQILLDVGDRVLDVTNLTKEEMRIFRRNAQIIFQDPFSSLNPRMNILETVGEPLRNNGIATGRDLEERVKRIIVQVGLRVEHLRRFPHSFSGGQRQRIGIARALALNPKFIVCDEPIAALDVSIQAQIVNLLEELQEAFGLTYLFISHDLSMVRHIADRVAVMYLGKIVELADRERLYADPAHPYTQALLSAVPEPDPEHERHRRHIILKGDVPSPANPPRGCNFSTRCPRVMDICRQIEPEFLEVSPGRFTACHLHGTTAQKNGEQQPSTTQLTH